MTDYLSSFLIDPVVRQARRISESPGILPESIRTWNPLNTSPPHSIGENEVDRSAEATAGGSPWTFASLRSMMPSPPWEAYSLGDNDVQRAETHMEAAFPSLESSLPQNPLGRQQPRRTDSETSLNPMNELPDRSRFHDDVNRGHSSSDPTSNQTGNPFGAVAQNRDGIEEYEAYNRSREGSRELPANDGMTQLRRKIQAIQRGHSTPAEKARMVHSLMMEKYRLSQFLVPRTIRSASPISFLEDGHLATPSSIDPEEQSNQDTAESSSGNREQDVMSAYNLSPADLVPTYAPAKSHDSMGTPEADEVERENEPRLGCVHYIRNVKLQCYACKRWYTCRFCHDHVEDHVLPRPQTRNMLCMLCRTPQKAGQWCTKCGEQTATYYCPICKLWNNDPQKSVYHCDDCGICRLGQGIGKDFFHCKTCAVCMDINIEFTHRCIERSTKCDCPICGEYMFTSPQSVVFMRCGHSIHDSCLRDWGITSYKCPICSKSIVNMESQFRNLERHIETQPMPPEYQDTKALVYCNDCTAKTAVKYHFLGLKCDVCESYNTTQLSILGNNPRSPSLGPTSSTQEDIDSVAEPSGNRPRSAMSELPGRTTPSSPSWIVSPERAARSVSPVVGNYFGIQRRDTNPRRNPRTDDSDDEEEEPWWWPAGMRMGMGMGIESPLRGIGRLWEEGARLAAGNGGNADEGEANEAEGEEGSEEESDDEDDELGGMELDDDDEEDEEDQMDLLGHR